MEIRNAVVRATNWVGDAVMSLPALRALREAHPRARLTILGRPMLRGLYEREPFCDEFVDWKGYRWSSVAEIRGRRFDAAILLQNAFGAAATVWLAGVPRRVGYGRDGRGWMLTDSIPVPRPGELPPHESYYYLELLRRANLIETKLPDEPLIRLAGVTAAPSNRIGISPGAAYGGAKRWLPERFAETALRLAAEWGSAVDIFGTRDEVGVCEQVRQLVEAGGVRASNWAGKTSLREFIDAVACCRVMITNDSGSMHIASAAGVPTVTVFGATNHITTGPTGPLARIVREPVECSPCLKRECPIDHRCMTRVTADRVAAVALELVK